MSQRNEGRVLLVDDDAAVLRAYEGVLGRRGWKLTMARDGLEAKECVDRQSFDVIVSDINMPGYGGLKFLRSVRERDLDVPVILVTGTPSVDSALRAIEYGIFRYLLKPLPNEVLVEVVTRAAQLHEMARLKRAALEIVGGEGKWLGDRAALESHFDGALARLWMAFQPIVSWRDRRVFGYEALLRSDEPTLSTPLEFLKAAERLGRVQELGRTVRASVAEAARTLEPEATLFVNLHASDIADESLLDSWTPLSGIAHRVVLEVTERASLDTVKNVSARIQALKEMGFRIAVDDLGAGYAGLTSFTQLEPQIVKLDMSLVRGIDTHVKKQKVVGSMRQLCADLGMLVVAEGVETPEERDTLAELGCDLLQGYLFARPGRGFPQPVW